MTHTVLPATVPHLVGVYSRPCSTKRTLLLLSTGVPTVTRPPESLIAAQMPLLHIGVGAEQGGWDTHWLFVHINGVLLLSQRRASVARQSTQVPFEQT